MDPKHSDLILTGVVQEMSAASIDVPVSSKVNMEKLTEGDDQPTFVTLEVASASVSNNKNRYSRKTLEDIAEQINDTIPDAYMGHLDDKERATKYPEPQTMWIGAVVKNLDGVDRLFAKGYVYADSKMKTILRKSTAAGKKLSVSIYGSADRVFDKVAKVYDILNFKLESLDWARPGAQGLDSKYLPAITQEQVIDMDPKELLKELTLEQLKEARPDLVEEIKAEVKAEVEPVTPPAPAENADSEVAKEMTEVKTILGVTDGSVKDRVSEMVEENKVIVSEMQDLLTDYIDTQVSKEVKKEAVKNIVKEMVTKEVSAWTKSGVDMAINSVLQSKVTRDLISEMTKETQINPLQDSRHPDTAKSKYISK